MPIAAAAPPESVPVFSGFDYVRIDEARHRAYAAHTASKRLLIVDTTSGKVTGQVDVGPMHGVVVDPATGYVFTGNGTDRSVSKVDPVAMTVLATVDVPGDVDAIAYDPALHRLYADQDNGGHVYVIDGNTMKQTATITMPSEDLESPWVDGNTHAFFQNLADATAYAIVDPQTLKITKVVKTPQIKNNHPLLYLPVSNVVLVGGKNAILSAYTPGGEHLGDVAVQPGIDQCNTGATGAVAACAGNGIVTVVKMDGKTPVVVGKIDTGKDISHVGIDESTGDLWVVWSDATGDYVQRLHWSP